MGLRGEECTWTCASHLGNCCAPSCMHSDVQRSARRACGRVPDASLRMLRRRTRPSRARTQRHSCGSRNGAARAHPRRAAAGGSPTGVAVGS